MEKKKPQKRNSSREHIEMGFGLGKLPPQAVSMEESILGAAMLEPECLISIVKILREDSFYKTAHQNIYNAMLTLHDKGTPIDILSVTEELKQNGTLEEIGGPYYITQLTNRIASAANIEFWCFKVEEFAIMRRMIRICSETIRDCYSPTEDVFRIVDTHQKLIDSGAVFLPGKAPDAKYRTASTMKMIEEAMASDRMMGATLGIPVVDDITCGFMGGDMVVIAGRPGMGKTACVLNTLYKSNKKVALFELEMSEYQVTNREFAMFTGLPTEQIKLGRLNREEYNALLSARTFIDAENHLIDTSPSLDVSKLRAKLWDYIHKHGVQMAIIDYLQLMNIDEEDKYSNYSLAIGKVTRAIKLMAKQFDIPIIVLSQLNRNVESRGGEKKPQLSDLRDSGAIEQDADCVIFLYRESYYNPDAVSPTGESMKNIIQFIVAKNRQGRLGPVETGYDPATNNFGDEFKDPSAQHKFYKL